MIRNCNKITNNVSLLIKQLIYDFIIAQSFYIYCKFLNSLWIKIWCRPKSLLLAPGSPSYNNKLTYLQFPLILPHSVICSFISFAFTSVCDRTSISWKYLKCIGLKCASYRVPTIEKFHTTYFQDTYSFVWGLNYLCFLGGFVVVWFKYLQNNIFFFGFLIIYLLETLIFKG